MLDTRTGLAAHGLDLLADIRAVNPMGQEESASTVSVPGAFWAC